MFYQRIVSIACFILIGIIFLSARVELLPKNICDNNIVYNIFREFIHIDFYHFILNMVALYYVSSLEVRIGSKTYAAIIAAIVVLSATITYVTNVFFNFKCAIGFSGVLLGLMVYNLLNQEKIDWKAVIYLLLISINPITANGQAVSISGHIIGIVSGIIVFFVQQLVTKLKSSS